MNTEILTGIIAAGLHTRAELADVPIWTPTDELQEGDCAILVSVSGADDVLPGNYTYRLSGDVQMRQRYAEIESTGAQLIGTNTFTHAVTEVLAGLERTQSVADESPGWYVLAVEVSPAVTETDETYMIYRMMFEAVMQF